MKTNEMMVMGLAFAFAVTMAGEALARGGNGGGAGNGQGIRSQTTQTTVTRPADSQRRDGTFQTTGTTASGSITRPDNGNGLQDGSRLNTTTLAVVAPLVNQ